MRCWLPFALALAGCTTTGVTRTQAPLDCVRFVSDPNDHHGFSGAGATRAFVADTDTLALWASSEIYGPAGSVDSLALYVRPTYEENTALVTIPVFALRGTERRWYPLGQWGEVSLYLMGMGGGVGDAVLLADGQEGVSAKESLGLFGGTAVGMVVGIGLPYSYRRVSRCEVGS